jgi:hypothetical protein
MKKMIIVALVGAMLIPGQMMASNDRGRKERPRVENRGGNRKEYRNHDNRRGNDRGKVIVVNKPQRPIVINRHNPRPCPPPPPRRHHHCHHNDVADAIGAAAALVGLIGIVSAVSQ